MDYFRSFSAKFRSFRERQNENGENDYNYNDNDGVAERGQVPDINFGDAIDIPFTAEELS